jgi:hypothetical protein
VCHRLSTGTARLPQRLQRAMIPELPARKMSSHEPNNIRGVDTGQHRRVWLPALFPAVCCRFWLMTKCTTREEEECGVWLRPLDMAEMNVKAASYDLKFNCEEVSCAQCSSRVGSWQQDSLDQIFEPELVPLGTPKRWQRELRWRSSPQLSGQPTMT